MPIRPQFRSLYPLDWPQLSASIRFRRAKGRCEACGRPHGETVKHLGDGRWWDASGSAWRDGRGRMLSRSNITADDPTLPVTRIVLATAHLDHDPTNNRARNLKALCQRCRMLHDRDEHRRQRMMTLRMRKAMGDLFVSFQAVTTQMYGEVSLWSCTINRKPGVALVLVNHAGEGKLAVVPLFVAITDDMQIDFEGEEGSGGGGPKNPRESFEAAAPSMTTPNPG